MFYTFPSFPSFFVAKPQHGNSSHRRSRARHQEEEKRLRHGERPTQNLSFHRIRIL